LEPLLPPLLTRIGIWPKGRLEIPTQVGPVPSRRDVGGKHHELRQALNGRGPRPRLPLGPLLAQPAPYPSDHVRVRQRWLPRRRLRCRRVEPIAVVNRSKQQRAVPLGLGASSECLGPLSAVDRPSNDPRQRRSCRRSPVLNSVHFHFLDWSSHGCLLAYVPSPQRARSLRNWGDYGGGEPTGPDHDTADQGKRESKWRVS
jgi:hypothetical protein